MTLSLKDTVSYAEIKSRIQQYLKEHDDLDLSELSAVSLIVDTIAAGIEVSKFEVLRALQETFLQSAVLPDSIYQLIDTLHVQLVCKSPCYSSLTVSSRQTTRIPAYTQFVSDGLYVYNRERATANTTPQNIEVYQGQVQRESLMVENDKPSIILKYDNFRVSLDDIHVIVGSTEWNSFNGDEYALSSTDKVFLTDVNYKGEVRIYFGNGTFGALPSIGDKIEITYAITDGAKGNQQIQSKLFVSTDYPQITAYGVGTLLGGDDERDADFYKTYGPWLSASKGWASRKKDFAAIASKFPGVVDCAVQGQADIAPNDRRWENFIQLTLLTKDTWSGSSWNKLTTKLAMASSDVLHFLKKDAVPIKINVGFTVYCESNALLDSVKHNIEEALKAFLSPKAKCLGKSVFMGDLEQVLVKADPTYIVSYTRNFPNTDYTNLEYYEYITYDNITINCEYAQ